MFVIQCCFLFYFHSVFAECHPFVNPENFFQGCIFDSCHVSNPVVECTSLQSYAAACAQAGVCLHWRNHTTLCGEQTPNGICYCQWNPHIFKYRLVQYITSGRSDTSPPSFFYRRSKNYSTVLVTLFRGQHEIQELEMTCCQTPSQLNRLTGK